MGFQAKGRPLNRHLDEQELAALVQSSSRRAHEVYRLCPDAIDEAERHVESCGMCRGKVLQYQQLVNGFSKEAAPASAPRGADCPRDQDVDWYEVVAGLWPELKARQLILHAASCDHCGPILRAATTVVNEEDPTPQEERLLAELRAPLRPAAKAGGELTPDGPLLSPAKRQFSHWRIFVPAVALVVIVGVLTTRPSSSGEVLSGPRFAEFAVNAHRQHAQGSLALEMRTDSPQAVNEWLQAKSQFSLALPTSPVLPGEKRPYHVEGARLLRVGGKTAAYVAYRTPADLVSLMVTPDSVTRASGGVEVDFAKLSFHYARVKGYKVVTWSVHGLTYALVSQEGNSTQRSCMVCHSAMKDRDLSRTPTPLPAAGNELEPMEQ
jgi:hypothetical protein